MMFVPQLSAMVGVLVGGWMLRSRISVPRVVATSVDDARPAAHERQMTRRQRRVLAGVGLLAAALVDPIMPVAIGLGLVVAPPIRRALHDRRRRVLIAAAVPDAIELLILMIHAGLTPHQAVRASSAQSPQPIRPGFAEVVRRLDRGQPLADALRGLPDALGSALDPVADTLAIAERYGTPIGDALAQLAGEVRQQRRRLAEADARKLPVRLSFPLVFCTLPSFVLVAIAPAVIAALSSLGDTTW
jgi:tight adherence protein C